jgi:protein-tyrosine-phosphatase
MAEGILKSILITKGITDIAVSSAGIAGLDNCPASRFAVEAAKLWDVDISGHRSRPIDDEIAENSDLILALSPNHVEFIRSTYPKVKDRTFLLKGFPDKYNPNQEGVEDPIGGTMEMYNHTYIELEEIIRRITGDIVNFRDSAEGR